MTTLTIEIPDEAVDDVVKYLNEKDVTIKSDHEKSLDDLTAEDYRRNFEHRAQKSRSLISKHV